MVGGRDRERNEKGISVAWSLLINFLFSPVTSRASITVHVPVVPAVYKQEKEREKENCVV